MPVVVKQVQVVKTVRKTVAKEVYVPPKRVKITIGKVKPKLPNIKFDKREPLEFNTDKGRAVVELLMEKYDIDLKGLSKIVNQAKDQVYSVQSFMVPVPYLGRRSGTGRFSLAGRLMELYRKVQKTPTGKRLLKKKFKD